MNGPFPSAKDSRKAAQDSAASISRINTELRQALESFIPPSQRLVIFQDIRGALYALDWLHGRFKWAGPLPIGLGFISTPASKTAEFVYPSAELGPALTSFRDDACPASLLDIRNLPNLKALSDHEQVALRQQTARLLASVDGGLAFIDYSGEFVPIPDLSVMNVLHQTPFATPLFPDHYLLGKQTQRVITLNVDDGTEVPIDVSSNTSNGSQKLEIATSTITICAVPISNQEVIDWSFSLTTVGSVGESPMRPNEAECLATASSPFPQIPAVCLPAHNWELNASENDVYNLSCAEVVVESALRRSIGGDGTHVSIDLCEVSNNIVPNFATSEAAAICATADNGVKMEIGFPAEILNIYPLKTLHKTYGTLTLGDGLVDIEPGQIPIDPKLYYAVHRHLQLCAIGWAKKKEATTQGNITSSLELTYATREMGESHIGPKAKQQAVKMLLTSAASNAMNGHNPWIDVDTRRITMGDYKMKYLIAPATREGPGHWDQLNKGQIGIYSLAILFALLLFLLRSWLKHKKTESIGAKSENLELEEDSSSTQLLSWSPKYSPPHVDEGRFAVIRSSTSLMRNSTERLSRLWNRATWVTSDAEVSHVPPHAPLRQLLDNGKFNRTFYEARMIGRGGFGSVYRVRHRMEPGNTLYALKVVECEASAAGDFRGARYFREVATNRDILSKYVVRYFTWWCEEPQFLPNYDSRRLETTNAPIIENGELLQLEGSEDDVFASRKMLESGLDQFEKEVSLTSRCDNNVDPRSISSRYSSDSNGVYFVEDEEKNGITKFCKGSTTLKVRKPKTLQKCRISLIIQMEWCPGQTLRVWLANPIRVVPCLMDYETNIQRMDLAYFKQMIKGIRDIHQRGIVHRDVKPENIFVDSTRLKIGDFGLSKLVRQEVETCLSMEQDGQIRTIHELAKSLSVKSAGSIQGAVIGTPSYTAPEGGVECTEKADIYSCGLILLELLSHKMLTSHERHTLLASFRNDRITPEYFCKVEYRGWSILLDAMCQDDPKRRPSAETVIEVIKRAAENISIRGYELDSNITTQILAARSSE